MGSPEKAAECDVVVGTPVKHPMPELRAYPSSP